jgi:predicted porin
MQKKILVAAVAGALASPLAFAQSSVTIYGAFDHSLHNYRITGGAGNNSVSKWDLYNQSSRIGFRGEENLGGGLRAWFQAVNGLLSDGRQNNPTGGAFASRNSAVGLTGGWGTILAGIWDSPYKQSILGVTGMATVGGLPGHNGPAIGNSDSTGTNVNSNCQNISATITQVFCGQAEGGGTQFHRRISNVVQYWSPKFGGFDVKFAFSANEEKARNTATFNNNPGLWAINGTYAAGPIYVTAAYEQHKGFRDASTTNTNVKDKGWLIGGGYNFGMAALNVAYERLKYGNAAGTGASETGFTRPSWFIGVSVPVGPAGSAIRGGFSRAKLKSCGGGFTGAGGTNTCNDSSARVFTLGYEYAMSKRTAAYINYGTVRNDSNSTVLFNVSPIGPDGVTSAITGGADQRSLGVGLKHTF